jgi:hypothetical protein
MVRRVPEASQHAKSVACVRDIRSFPWQSYLLPDDGRKARAVAEQRRMLAIQLATYADGDGTRISAGIKRLMTELGWAKRTVYRRLEDLRRLELVAAKDGLTKEHGTALRRLNVAALRTPDAGVPGSAAEVPDSRKQECQIDVAGVPDRAAEVPDSIAGVPCIGGTQPPCLTGQPTGQPTDRGGWEGWILKNLATMGQPNETTQTWLQKQSAERGQDVLLASLDKFLIRPSGFFRVTNPWALFISESARLIESALQDAKAADERARLSAATDAYVRQQQDAHAKFMEYEPPRPSEVDPDECMAEKSG